MKIKELAEVQIGYQPRGRIEPDPNGTYRIIQVKDFDESNELDAADLYPITPEREPERYRVSKDDILFLSRGRSNFSAILREPLENVIAAGVFYVVRVNKNKVLPEYLAWYINLPSVQTKLKNMAQATNIPLIPKAAFEELDIDVPVIAVQEKIVRIAELQRIERELSKRLEEKRIQFLQAVCLNAARQSKKENKS